MAFYRRWGIKTARVRPDQDQRPPARRRQPGLHQRARARRRRRTLLRPAASLRTRSRGIAPPSPLPRRVPPQPELTIAISVVYPTPASSSVPAGATKTLPIARAYVQWRCLLTNNLRLQDVAPRRAASSGCSQTGWRPDRAGVRASQGGGHREIWWYGRG